jgi:hypothetical protein
MLIAKTQQIPAKKFLGSSVKKKRKFYYLRDITEKKF